MKSPLSVKPIAHWETQTAQDVLHYALEKYKGKIALVTSFSAEDVALIDMIHRLGYNIPLRTLDTGRLLEETYEVIERIQARYKVKIETFFPSTHEVEKMVQTHGPNLFYQSVPLRKLCCHVRKVEPLKRAVADVSAWICGLRRGQSATRTEIQKFTDDPLKKDLVKIAPLADWSEKQLWEYIQKHNVPYNKLHDKNYPSIGCAPCTRAISKGEDIRAGRWWWENPEHRECGLHSCGNKRIHK